MRTYDPKPTWKFCIICGEFISGEGELIGGKVKHGGTRCAHKSCWEKEQAELAGKERREK